MAQCLYEHLMNTDVSFFLLLFVVLELPKVAYEHTQLLLLKAGALQMSTY